jgi:brefeldin A-inhibited guanine nucleotide-exchange protein
LVVDYVGGGSAKSDAVKEQERKIKVRSLACLVAIVDSLVEWSIQVAPTIPIVGVGGMFKPSSPTKLSRDGVREEDSGEEDSGANPFLEAIVPTKQSNPVMVDKRPLSSISLVNSRNFAGSGNISPITMDGGDVGDQGMKVEERATRKQLLRQSMKLFEKKPNKGVKAFIEAGFCGEDAVSVAAFLHETSGLDKSGLGEFLGDHDAFNVKVMHAFIDGLTFGTGFVSALRGLLQTFRLPGEAQKIGMGCLGNE